jgi:hypothetical protein
MASLVKLFCHVTILYGSGKITLEQLEIQSRKEDTKTNYLDLTTYREDKEIKSVIQRKPTSTDMVTNN